MKKLLFALIVLALFCSCQSNNRINFIDGEEIKVHPGDTFMISLEENPTTGYSWTCEIEGSAIVLAYDDYKPSKEKEGLVGTGGLHSFTFRAINEGFSKVTFRYKRPWEEDAIETKSAIINVKKKALNVNFGLQLSHRF